MGYTIKWRQLSTLCLGIFALAVVYFQLPETPNPFDLVDCKTCMAGNPYIPLMGAGYFTALIAFSVLFPEIFSGLFARAGLLWAVLLALGLTYLKLPQWCIPCIVAHCCHVSMWMIWVLSPPAKEKIHKAQPERICLALTLSIAVVALFSALNLTFLAYHTSTNSAADLQIGEMAPVLFPGMKGTGFVINFISPSCTHCKEQLPLVEHLAKIHRHSGYRFINVGASLPSEIKALAPHTEWLEDKQDTQRHLFKVSGYPTLFVIRPDGRIAQIIPGLSDQLHSLLDI